MGWKWWMLLSTVLGCSSVDSTSPKPDVSVRTTDSTSMTTGPAAATPTGGIGGAAGSARADGNRSGDDQLSARGVSDSAGTSGASDAGRLAAAGQGASGHSAPAAGVGGAAGRQGEGGAGGSAGTASAGHGGAPTEAPTTGSLPSAELDKFGPFKATIANGTGPDNIYRLDRPEPLGANALLHPAVVFAAGGGFPENYDTLLRYLASHGFVVLTYAATSDDGQGIIDGIDWLIQQNEAASGMLAGKLDTDHVAAGGHSFGSLATFNAAPDPRITTTLHLQGGTLDPHEEVKNLRAPAQFICGETPTDGQDGTFTGDMANPNCAIDFERATTPVFYGSLKGAAHIQLTESVATPEDPLRLQMLGAIAGWLRWWLANDQTQRARYIGPDCELCQPSTGWTIKQKGLM